MSKIGRKMKMRAIGDSSIVQERTHMRRRRRKRTQVVIDEELYCISGEERTLTLEYYITKEEALRSPLLLSRVHSEVSLADGGNRNDW